MLTMAERKNKEPQSKSLSSNNKYYIKVPCCFDEKHFSGFVFDNWIGGTWVMEYVYTIIVKFVIIWWKLFKWMGLSVIRSLRFISLDYWSKHMRPLTISLRFKNGCHVTLICVEGQTKRYFEDKNSHFLKLFIS